ncbi:hypothetical protein ACHQM5_007217 [Ranunculus cassubicifolius]
MALIAHQTPGSYALFPSRSKVCIKEVNCKPFVSLHLSGKLDRSNLSSRRSCLRSQPIFPAKVKRLKVSAFKGVAQNDESGGRSNGSKVSKNSVKLSFVSHDEETIAESPDTQKPPVAYTSDREDKVGGSPAIQKLFKKWLIMLRTQSSANHTSNGIFGENGPVQTEISQSPNGSQNQENSQQLLKSAWCFFWGLDPTIKIPLLIFIPFYVAVNLIYGAEVSKELTPLWVFGPVIVALYIKMLQGLYALYVFTFKQTVKVAKSLPSYVLLVYNFVAEGKLKAILYAWLWKPVDDFKNLDYKKLFKRKSKEFTEWAKEKYLDYVESIWPYYCRTIRFLKKANLI